MIGQGLSSLIPKKEEKEREKEERVIHQEQEKEEFDSLTSKNIREKLEAISKKVVSFDHFEKEKKDFKKVFKKTSEAVFQIEVEKIKPNPFQPRKEFKEEELKELAESIRTYGIIQPLVVSKIEKETESGTLVEYQLVAGERRLLAAKLLGLKTVPVIIKVLDNHRLNLELALIENLQRTDLNPLETARAYTRLYEEFGLTQQEIALRVGKSREAIANTMRLLKLPLYIQEALAQGEINESQARLLLSIEDSNYQRKLFEELINQKLSTRALKKKIVFGQKTKIDLNKESLKDSQSLYWQNRLEEYFGMPLILIKKNGRRKLVINFSDERIWQDFLVKIFGDDL